MLKHRLTSRLKLITLDSAMRVEMLVKKATSQAFLVCTAFYGKRWFESQSNLFSNVDRCNVMSTVPQWPNGLHSLCACHMTRAGTGVLVIKVSPVKGGKDSKGFDAILGGPGMQRLGLGINKETHKLYVKRRTCLHLR